MAVFLTLKIEHAESGGLNIRPVIDVNKENSCNCEINFAHTIVKTCLDFANTVSADFPPKKRKELNNVH